MAIMARTRHYGHGRGGKVVVVTRKLGGVGAEPTIVSPFHNSTSQSRAQHQAYIQSGTETRSSVQCSVSRQLRAWRSFSPCWGEQRSCKLSGEGGREAVSGVKGSKHTAQHQSGDKAAGVFVSFFVDTLLPES